MQNKNEYLLELIKLYERVAVSCTNDCFSPEYIKKTFVQEYDVRGLVVDENNPYVGAIGFEDSLERGGVLHGEGNMPLLSKCSLFGQPVLVIPSGVDVSICLNDVDSACFVTHVIVYLGECYLPGFF